MKEEERMKQFLIVVDMQTDFVDGALGTPEAVAILPAVDARIRACREAGATVIATLDTHGENYMESAEGQKLPVVHCVKNTEGWQLHPAVREALAGRGDLRGSGKGPRDHQRRHGPGSGADDAESLLSPSGADPVVVPDRGL